MMHGSNMEGRPQFLNALTDEARAAFARLGVRRHFAVGDVLINEGDHTQDMVVLYKGVVKVTARLDGGRAALMDIKIAGDVVGEVAALDRGPRSATVTACGDVTAAFIPACALVPFLHANPETMVPLMGVFCGRLRRSDRWRLEFAGYPVLVRLARVLVELAVSYGRKERNGVVRIDVNLSQPEFAALTGSTTNTVHKALARLRRDGLISTGERRTFVRDLPRLSQVARLSASVAEESSHRTA
ncbi:Crp/Fnr family transcriptional regulator [Streptomyces murinus]|uniref:Crp/Fnr family transcriptional regulator n=1 Tax=Streptomyces murinus TaxID=33900 RepID=UPI000A3A8F43|nr:Crp/Fnr family transcriptional regulator [Streptomyces murinus]